MSEAAAPVEPEFEPEPEFEHEWSAFDRAAGVRAGEQRARLVRVVELEREVSALRAQQVAVLGRFAAVSASAVLPGGWHNQGEQLDAGAEELAVAMTSWRAQLVELVRRTLGAGGRPDDATHAATIVAALDGVLLAALQRPAGQRPAFLRSSLELLLGSLVEPPAPA